MSLFNLYNRPYVGTDLPVLYKPGSTSHSEYVPIICFPFGERIIKGDKAVFLHRLRVPHKNSTHMYTRVRKYSDFMENFKGGYHWKRLVVPSLSEEGYFSSSGIIFHVDSEFQVEILMCVAVKSSQIFTLERPVNVFSPIDYSKFTLIVNNKFMDKNSLHFTIFRNANRDIIEPAHELLDVLYTNRIDDLCFSVPPLTLPKFNTFVESKAHLQNINGYLANNTDIINYAV